MKALLFLACFAVAVSGIATWMGTMSSPAGAADTTQNDGDPLDDTIQKRIGKPDQVTGGGRVLRYDLQNGATLTVSGGEFLQYDLQNGDNITLIVRGAEVIHAMHKRKKGDNGDLGDAIQKRFGKPDRVTGSGRSFLHYDLTNGDTLTFVVSGGDVIGVLQEKKKN